MIEGFVNEFYEPVVPLTLHGAAGQTLDIQAMIVTGYTGFLTLPPPVVTELGLSHRGYEEVNLRNGSVVECDVYGVTVMWDGLPRHIEAAELGNTPTVGMGMLALDNHHLSIEFEVGGKVVIQAKK